MQQTKFKTYQEALVTEGVDPELAKQAALVIANDIHGLPRTARGQRVVAKAHKQLMDKCTS
ncbi:MAG: hypothetical protein ACKO2Z_28280 [Sphaerospermopsis kisseleviana]